MALYDDLTRQYSTALSAQNRVMGAPASVYGNDPMRGITQALAAGDLEKQRIFAKQDAQMEARRLQMNQGSGGGNFGSSLPGVGSGGVGDLSGILSALQAQAGKSAAGIDSTMTTLNNLLGQYSKASAFTDAQALMDQRAQAEREKNMPAIQRSIEGAGTSANAMAGLLSQKFAADVAQGSAALGAEQAKAYGGISSNLSGSLANLAGNGDPMSKVLASILQTQMQGDASTRNAQIAADSSKYSVDNKASGTSGTAGGMALESLSTNDTRVKNAQLQEQINYMTGLLKRPSGTVNSNPWA